MRAMFQQAVVWCGDPENTYKSRSDRETYVDY
jgi:hypothetical protein